MIIGIIWVILGVILLGFYNALLLLEERLVNDPIKHKQVSTYWHMVGAAIFLFLSATAYHMFGIKYVPFTLSLFWSLFAGIVHIVGLNKPFFFVGTTAKTDRLIRNLFPKNPETISGIIKILFVLGSIFILLFV